MGVHCVGARTNTGRQRGLGSADHQSRCEHTVHLVDPLVELETEGHMSFSGVAMRAVFSRKARCSPVV